MKRAVVFSPDAVPVGDVLAAGPGIRYFEIAAGLHRAGFNVTLAVPADDFSRADIDFEVVPWKVANISKIVTGADLAVLPQVHSGLSSAFPSAAPDDLPAAVDLYDPVLIENLGLQPRTDGGVRSFAGYLAGIAPILRRGDYFFCANTRQYYYYLGVLSALGRINPLTFDRRMLEIVPFGVPAVPPVKTKRVMRGSVVGENDPVILWFSGIYPWFDAMTLIKAMPLVLEVLPDAKLVVVGGVHPRGHAPDSEYRSAVTEATALGINGRSVLFIDQWCPYPERVNWYLEADVAVTTHKRTLETELSHRTRVIDFIWAGLPTIVSRGDEVGALLEDRGAGAAVEIGDVRGLADKIIYILKDETVRRRMSSAARDMAADLNWDKVLKPLLEWAGNPKTAPDRTDRTARRTLLQAAEDKEGRPSILPGGGLFDKAKNVYQDDGLAAALKRTLGYGLRKIKRN